MTRQRPSGDAGSMAVMQAGVLLVVVILAAVATVEVTALLRASAVAATAADAGSLAAVTALQPGGTAGPRDAAAAVATANGARLESIRLGPTSATVEVVVAVDSRLLGQIGIDEVRATSSAALVPDGDVVTSQDAPRGRKAARAAPCSPLVKVSCLLCRHCRGTTVPPALTGGSAEPSSGSLVERFGARAASRTARTLRGR